MKTQMISTFLLLAAGCSVDKGGGFEQGMELDKAPAPAPAPPAAR